MRLLIPCMTCLEEDGKPTEKFTRVEFRDDGKYELTCSRGHKTTTILQQQKFEVLFEIGAHAIVDGYYREAVSSFAASLERFYAFAIRVFVLSASGTDTLFQECWKFVSNQSERQLGAFIFLWAQEFEEQPELLSNQKTSFRNAVIHKGKIPTNEEALAFGNAVLDILRPNMLKLQRQLSDTVQQVVVYHLGDARSPDTEYPVLMMGTSTIVSLSFRRPKVEEDDLEHHLARLRSERALVGNV